MTIQGFVVIAEVIAAGTVSIALVYLEVWITVAGKGALMQVNYASTG